MKVVKAQLDTLTFAECSRQEASPLFSALPGELRNQIFRLALAPYEDLSEGHAYPTDSYWYRPGFRGPLRVTTALLRTCKRVYLETRGVVMGEAEPAFWFNRGPDHRSGRDNCNKFFDGLEARDAANVNAVRLFMQMYELESGRTLNALMSNANFLPRKLTITVRYSDFWNWEFYRRLRMAEEWLKTFQGPPSLKELVLECETVDRPSKREELMKLVHRNKTYRLRLRDGAGHLSAAETKLAEWRWQGSGRLGGQVWPHARLNDTVDYLVVVDRWTWKPEGQSMCRRCTEK